MNMNTSISITSDAGTHSTLHVYDFQTTLKDQTYLS